MKKAELIESISVGADISEVSAERVLESIILRVTEAVSKNEIVQIGGLGLFTQNVRGARKGRNPGTGAIVQIPATKSIGFKAGIAFKRQINNC